MSAQLLRYHCVVTSNSEWVYLDVGGNAGLSQAEPQPGVGMVDLYHFHE